MAIDGENCELTLKIWGSDWDLPTIDHDCLTVITYAKFMKAPLKIQETIPSRTVTGTLPELQIEESVFSSPLNIISILRREGFNADFSLNSIDHADTLAYLALVEEKLKPGLLQNLWLDSGNYVNATRKAYSKCVGFLRSFLDIPQMRNKIETNLLLRRSGTAAEKEANLYKEAKNCITLLSNRLGKKDFFFGSGPSTFDAVVFSHLSLFLKAPLVSTDLKNHLTSYDNLCKYSGRITQRYFKNDSSYPGEVQNPVKEISEARLKERRSLMISCGVAVLVNIGYLLAMGLVIPRNSRSGQSELMDVEDVLD